jgi:hypothetical protein
MSEFNFPTEIVELPSKGLLYPEGHPLKEGKVEMKYMTAREEDILTNQNYIQKGIVLDKLLESLLVTKVPLSDFLLGDKNAILFAARVLGYGKDYTFTYKDEEITVDLSQIEMNYLDDSLLKEGNQFEFTLPHSNIEITFKLLTQEDDNKIQKEIKGIKKVNKLASPDLSTRLKYIITSVKGDTDVKTIRHFVDNYLLARDSKALRGYIKNIQPDVKMVFDYEGPDGLEQDISLPINATFFWPDA